MKPVSILLCVLMVAGWSVSAPGPAARAEPEALGGSMQLIVVTTSGWNAVEGRLQRYERAAVQEQWHPVGEPIAIVVGKSGLGWGIGVIANGREFASGPVKKEGDGKAPAGIFTLGTAFGYAPQPLPGLKMPYLNLSPSIECVDDVASKHYNRIVDRSAVAPDWNSSEHMRDTGELYRWGVVVDHNGPGRGGSPPEAGAGSCVFLHIWRSHDQGTAGCTAMSQIHLESLLTWLDPGRKPLLVQLPEPAYAQLVNRWKLPQLVNSTQE